MPHVSSLDVRSSVNRGENLVLPGHPELTCPLQDFRWTADFRRVAALVAKKPPCTHSCGFVARPQLCCWYLALQKTLPPERGVVDFHPELTRVFHRELTRLFKQIDSQLAEIDAEILARMKEAPVLARRFDILCSIPGIGSDHGCGSADRHAGTGRGGQQADRQPCGPCADDAPVWRLERPRPHSRRLQADTDHACLMTFRAEEGKMELL